MFLNTFPRGKNHLLAFFVTHRNTLGFLKNVFLIISLCFSIMLSHTGGGARGVMVIVVGNGHGNTSSNPGRD